MRPGTHHSKLKSSNWLSALATSYFNPKMFRWSNDFVGSCGTAALATLTGIDPVKVDRKMPKTNDYWTDRAMKDFLRKNGYEVTEITVSRVTQCAEYQEDPIGERHVLLVSQEVLKGEGTWAVLYNDRRYHNFEIEPINPFEFINNPLSAVYAISHPRWCNMPPKNKVAFVKRYNYGNLGY